MTIIFSYWKRGPNGTCGISSKIDNGKIDKSETQFRDDAKAQEEAESVAVATEEAITRKLLKKQ